jgi:hypothetical protein
MPPGKGGGLADFEKSKAGGRALPALPEGWATSKAKARLGRVSEVSNVTARRSVHAYLNRRAKDDLAGSFPLFASFDRMAVMAALQPVPGCTRMRFEHAIGTDVDVGTHIFLNTVQVPTQAHLDSVVNAAHASYAASCAGLLHNQARLTLVSATDLSDPAGPFSENAVEVAGTRAGAPHPANACALMTIPIERRYRGGKPRAYWPWGSQADVATPQTWSTAFLDACLVGWNDLITAILTDLRAWASASQMCSISYFSGRSWVPDHLGNYHRIPTPRPVPKVDFLKSDPFFAPVIGSQRGRLRPN